MNTSGAFSSLPAQTNSPGRFVMQAIFQLFRSYYSYIHNSNVLGEIPDSSDEKKMMVAISKILGLINKSCGSAQIDLPGLGLFQKVPEQDRPGKVLSNIEFYQKLEGRFFDVQLF
jgi:hypothetical protein